MDENKEETSDILLNEESSNLEEEIVETTTSDGQTTITIYEHFCKGCDICVEVCPKDVLRMVVALDRWEGRIDSTVSKISEATIVLSLPPLKPTNQGRSSSKYSCLKHSLID